MVENAAQKTQKKPTLREQVQTLEMALDASNTQTAILREQLDNWVGMMAREDMGWASFDPSFMDVGPSLNQMKIWSAQLRKGLANVHMNHGLKLRTNYIWGGGIDYGVLPSGKGLPPVQKWIDDPINQANFFGTRARHQRESANFTDGIVLYRGYTKGGMKYVEPIPLRQITATMRSPDRPDQIWAYKREYIYSDGSGKEEFVREWRYTDQFISRKDDIHIPVLKGEQILEDEVIFDFQVNTQIGHAFGIPDSLGAMAWANVYRNFMMNGKVMSDALAQFAFQVTTKSKTATQNVGAKLADMNQAGSTLVGDAVLNSVNSAGKGYDFNSGRPLLSVVAAALEVSVIALSSDPAGGKGGGYGTAQTLDLPTRLAVEARRQIHIEDDARVLTWMGVPTVKQDITFAPLDDSAEMYRQLQALALVYDRGVIEPDKFADAALDLLGVNGNIVPRDVIVPATVSGETALQKAQGLPQFGQIPAVPKPPTGPGDTSGAGNGGGFQSGGSGKKRAAATTANPSQGHSSNVGKGADGGKQGRTDTLT